MTLSQRIRLLSFDDLLSIADIVEQETTRRNDFIDSLADISFKSLGLTINTRDLLYRIINSKFSVSTSKKNGDLTVRDLFALLKKEDWLYIEYLNVRAFLETRDALIRHKAPLEDYYGLFAEKLAKPESTKSAAKSLNNRLMDILDAAIIK